MAQFFSGLRPNSLESFEVFSRSNISVQAFLALNNHGRSLVELKLPGLNAEAVESISMLKGCTALRVLHLEDTLGHVNLEDTQNDVFLEVNEWLRQCKDLKDIQFRRFQSGPALLSSLILENSIRLTKLTLDGYTMRSSRDFHQALIHQPELEELFLKGDGEDVLRDDIEALVDSLCKLSKLKHLELKDVSDYFRDENIVKLAQHLPQLENLYTSGFGITDAIWDALATLQSLRSLVFNAMTRFTLNGILDFISKLGPGNRGLLLSVMNADPDYNLGENEQSLVRDTIAAKVDGRFDFTPFRGKLHAQSVLSYLLSWADMKQILICPSFRERTLINPSSWKRKTDNDFGSEDVS